MIFVVVFCTYLTFGQFLVTLPCFFGFFIIALKGLEIGEQLAIFLDHVTNGSLVLGVFVFKSMEADLEASNLVLAEHEDWMMYKSA